MIFAEALIRHIAAQLDGDFDDALDHYVSAHTVGDELRVRIEEPDNGDVEDFVLRVVR